MFQTNLLCCLIHLDPIARTFASRLRAPKVDPSRLASSTQLSSLSSNLHKPLHASNACRHSHSVTRFVSEYCDI